MSESLDLILLKKALARFFFFCDADADAGLSVVLEVEAAGLVGVAVADFVGVDFSAVVVDATPLVTTGSS